MAEIQFNYQQLQKKIEDSIEKSKLDPNNKSLPEGFAAAILTCLSAKPDDNKDDSQKDVLKLWNEQIQNPAQLPFGDNYIIVQDVILHMVLGLIENGVISKLLSSQPGSFISPENMIDFGNNLITSLKKLDGCDVCLAYKTLDYPLTVITPVGICDIKDWFPGNNSSDGLHNCDMMEGDMHYVCEYFNYEDGICTITDKNVCDAVKSLQRKSIINPSDGEGPYTFKW